MAEKVLNIADLKPDDKNFNKGSQYGKHLLDKSFEKFGAGRSILLDKNNRIIAGNKATESYGEQGGEKVIVVETDGKTLVAVKRIDVDLDTEQGRELAMADNATQAADLVWDNDLIKEAEAQWGIVAEDWGVATWDKEAVDEGAVDDLFDEAEQKEKDLKVSVTIPLAYADKFEDIKASIKLTLEEWKGCKVE